MLRKKSQCATRRIALLFLLFLLLLLLLLLLLRRSLLLLLPHHANFELGRWPCPNRQLLLLSHGCLLLRLSVAEHTNQITPMLMLGTMLLLLLLL